ncbi:glycosyltransferase family 2 protein [Hanamia caeni]|uniref:Glycosyltransferase family 2 protein n=2 Tax=Hanamia caeni TaxID=2294116 RepID=A0A3M9N374_9BACT|nr:glycosyltransferase family 2 protein [Hanamia caeni]
MNNNWLDMNSYKPGLASVIIPTYNREVYLHEAVKSVIAQSYRPIECIIVDDGSTDNTREVVSKIRITDISSFTVKYIYQQNSGSQVARNTGTAAATGAYIQYLDSDDILYPDKIQQQVNYLMQHKECDGVFGDWQIGSVEKNETVVAYKDEDLISQLLTKRCIANFSFLMRRTIVEKIGDWDVNIKRNQEIDFHLRGVLAAGRFEYQPGLCGLWRIHQNERITTATGLIDILNFYRKWEILLQEKNKFSLVLSCKIADMLFWFVTQNKNNNNKELIMMLKEAIRLNPDIAMNRSLKLKFIKNVIGQDLALKIWLSKFRRSTRLTNNKVNS